MRTLFLLNWDLGVSLGFLMPSGFQIFWIQPIIIKFRDIILIIIYTLGGVERRSILTKVEVIDTLLHAQSQKIHKYQTKCRSDVPSL